MTAVTARLPFGLDAVVPPTVLGFLVVNGFTFGVDLLLLTLLRSVLGWPLPVAFTLAYATAFGLSFALNRAFNFRSHGPLERQLPVYAVAVAINYLVFILGVADGLSALGIEYHVARVLAACGEAVWMYSVLRWVVFPERR